MSIAGGLPNAIHRGTAAGCGVVQIFVKNQLRWAGRRLDEAETVEFRRALAGSGLRAACAHANYLINLATPDPAERARAVAALVDDLERAERLGLPFVVLHPGSHRGAGVEAGLATLVSALDEATRRTEGWSVRVALENTAGAGNSLGSNMEELGTILGRAHRPERLRSASIPATCSPPDTTSGHHGASPARSTSWTARSGSTGWLRST
jgi:deoxyribonuclease-4